MFAVDFFANFQIGFYIYPKKYSLMKPIIRTPLPGPNARRTISLMRRFAVNSTFEYPAAIKDGKGCWLQDTDGNWFLDFNSNICTQPLGYAHPDLMEVLQEKGFTLYRHR